MLFPLHLWARGPPYRHLHKRFLSKHTQEVVHTKKADPEQLPLFWDRLPSFQLERFFTMQSIPPFVHKNNKSSSHILTGTLPVRAFHPDGFFGTLHSDGQQPKVAALACDQAHVVALSLVGYDTSIGAALANLWNKVEVPFLFSVESEWHGPRKLERRADGYKQFTTHLEGTKEVHAIALPLSAHMAEGILHPPDLPQEPAKKDIAATASGTQALPVPVDRTRFVLGNWDEETPHLRSFLGQLYAMRVIFLHKNAKHPEWVTTWAEQLWLRGSTRKLITPLQDVLGIHAWKLSGDLTAWSLLIGDGVREGWLPWTEPVALPERELVLVR